MFRIKEALFDANGLRGKGLNHNRYSETDASLSFAADLLYLKQQFTKPALIVLDEIESLCFDISSSNHWRNGPDYLAFWQTIRSIYQQSPNLFSFCICGVNPRALEVPLTPDGNDNPLYHYVESKYLVFFRVEDVKAMLESMGGYMGMTFDAEVYTYLTDDLGGHPFLIRHAASRMYKKLSREGFVRKIHVKKQAYRDSLDDLTKSLQDYVSLILLILRDRYAEEYKLLQYLAADQHEKFFQFAQEDPTWIEHLLGYGIVEYVSGRYHFRINVVKMTIAAEARFLRSPESVEGRWELLSEVRNAFEVKLRANVKLVLRVSLGESSAREKMLASMVKSSQKMKASQLTYAEIFEGELYFSDLRRVVENNWTAFQNVYSDEQLRFSENMKCANKARADAHAKHIEKDEFEAAMAAIGWLQKAIDG